MTDDNNLNKRKGMPLINIRIPELYLGLIDELVEESGTEFNELSKDLGYPNRSAVIRVAISDLLKKEGKLPNIKGATQK